MKIDRKVRVELTHLDIEEAIRNYIATQVPDISEMKLTIRDVISGDMTIADLSASAEIELAPQPMLRNLFAPQPGEKNPLPPIHPDDFKRQFADAKPDDKTRRVR